MSIHTQYGSIDAVYTWVNGSDPIWLEKKFLHSPTSPAPVVNSEDKVNNNSSSSSVATNSSTHNNTNIIPIPPPPPPPPPFDDSSSSNRYRDSNELKYSIRSLVKNAPWINHIYIVTDDQVPSWLKLISNGRKISIVPHAAIFPNKTHLPVFSSPAIEAHLHNIPNLSPLFLYLNDDVLLGSPVVPGDFISLPNPGEEVAMQKFYTSWDVPKCSDGCSDTWLGDGYCDKKCNVESCNYDFPDCVNKTESDSRGGRGGGTSGRGKHSKAKSAKAMCAKGCPDSWVGDKVCDNRCNNLDCAFDGGDCGVQKVYNHVPGFDLSHSHSHLFGNTNSTQIYPTVGTVPHGSTHFYVNLTDSFVAKFLAANLTISETSWKSSRHSNENLVENSLLLKKFGLLLVILRRDSMEMCGNYCDKGEKFFNGTIEFEVDCGGGVDMLARFAVEVEPEPEQPRIGEAAHEEALVHQFIEETPKNVGEMFVGPCMEGVEIPGLEDLRILTHEHYEIALRANVNKDSLLAELEEKAKIEEEVQSRKSKKGKVKGKVKKKSPSAKLKRQLPVLDFKAYLENSEFRVEANFGEGGGAVLRGGLDFDFGGRRGGGFKYNLFLAPQSDTSQITVPFPVDKLLQQLAIAERKINATIPAPVYFEGMVSLIEKKKSSKNKLKKLLGKVFRRDGDEDIGDEGLYCSRFLVEWKAVNGTYFKFDEEKEKEKEKEYNNASLSLYWDSVKLIGDDNDNINNSTQTQKINNNLRGGNSEGEVLVNEASNRRLMASIVEQTVDWVQSNNIDSESDSVTNINIEKSINQPRRSRRRLLDTFGQSVVHVNQLYHQTFGVKQRKVPAHMPHMINRDVVKEMQSLWPSEWEKTSRNRFRSPDDMQYGFSYFYYLMYRKELQLGLNKGKVKMQNEVVIQSVVKRMFESEVSERSERAFMKTRIHSRRIPRNSY